MRNKLAHGPHFLGPAARLGKEERGESRGIKDTGDPTLLTGLNSSNNCGTCYDLSDGLFRAVHCRIHTGGAREH